MAGGAQDDGEEITGINVTPLVDVMLVLLIIFMVTANYIAQQAIEVNLPKAATGNGTESSPLSFVIDQNSNLYLNGDMVSYADLPNLIKAEREKDKTKELQALIGADIETPHGSVIKLIDTIRKEGISDFALNVEVQEKQALK